MDTLGVDIETYCDLKLKDVGLFKYVEHESFEVLMICYSYNGEKPIHWKKSNKQFVKDLTNPDIEKTAHNAAFERVCLAKHFSKEMPADQWSCTMVLSSICGYPMSLDMVGEALDLNTKKDSKGTQLINFFTKPCKATKRNGGRTRNLPHHDIGKWWDFIEYCKTDVATEQEVRQRLSYYKISNFEKALWSLDQKINATGVKVDINFVHCAIAIYHDNRRALIKEAKEITGLQNPNSLPQLKKWLSKETGEYIVTLTKDDCDEILKTDYGEDVKRVIEIRQATGKTSVEKYVRMLQAACDDDRLRGMFQFYGAGTGRWAGRIIQPHNLPRINIKDIDTARKIVANDDLDLLAFLYGNVSATLSQLIRPALVPAKGKRLRIADYSSIEARIIAWLAGENWRLKVFNTHGKIYEASASAMFKVPIEEIDADNPLRQRGKVAELALGYQGGAFALEKMGALKMGLKVEELEPLVKAWRKANPKIVQYWYNVEKAAVTAIRDNCITHVGDVKFFVKHRSLFIELPSGRRLAYPEVILRKNKFDRDSIWFKGPHEKTRKWVYQQTYGGKLVENIVQAIARDCLAYGLRRVDAKGYKIVLHVHDEIVTEDPTSFGSVEEIKKLMCAPISWAAGLPLDAKVEESYCYKK